MKILLVGMILISGIAKASAQEPEVTQKIVTIHPPAGNRIKAGDTITAAKIIHREKPVYPPLARQTRISGTVRLHAIIGTDGKVQQLEVISGHPLLVQSALDAVRKWEYEPTSLNGEPAEVDTTIDVIFALNTGTQQPTSKTLGSGLNASDPQFREDVLRLIQSTGGMEHRAAAGGKIFESLRPELLRALPAVPDREQIISAYIQRLLDLYQTDAFRDGLISAYAKYFDDEDVKALTQFYETPTGRKFNEVMPQFTSDMMQLGQQLAKDRMPDILKELCTEYAELAGKIPECPAPDKDKTSSVRLPVPESRNPRFEASR